MDEVTRLCRAVDIFPQNLNQPSAFFYHQSLYQTLNEHADRLFSPEKLSALDFFEFNTEGKGWDVPSLRQLDYHALTVNADFWPKCVKSESRLQTHLGLTTTPRGPDPRCRFL